MLGCAFTLASLDVLVKHLSGEVPTLPLVWFRYFFHVALMFLVFGPPMGALVGAVIASGPVLWVWQTPTLQQWPLLVALGRFGAGGHLLPILAFQRAQALSLAPISYTQLWFATGLCIVVTHPVPDRWTLVGMGVIALAGLYAALLQGMQGIAGRKRAGDEAALPTSD